MRDGRQPQHKRGEFILEAEELITLLPEKSIGAFFAFKVVCSFSFLFLDYFGWRVTFMMGGYNCIKDIVND